MIRVTLLSIAIATMTLFSSSAADPSTQSEIYEMRTYYTAPGKLDDLNARFRDHTMKLFEKHGIKNIGYFVPEGENPEGKLIYFLSYPDRDTRNRCWKDFMSDAEWGRVSKASEKNGRLVTKVEAVFLQPTDYSPKLKIESKGKRLFELRTYTTPPGKLNDLHARFRNHTMKLFETHGMENVVYWSKMPDQPGAGTTLVYLLAHKDKESGKKSFDSFRQDPDWVKVKRESEKKGSLTVPDGVKSEYLVPTDYSPLK